MSTQEAVIWQNDAASIVLIDIPDSIRMAQGTAVEPFTKSLCTSSPLDAPWPSNEPKSAEKRAKLQPDVEVQERHRQYETLLQTALRTLADANVVTWCNPRPFVLPPPRKRKRNDDDNDKESVPGELSIEFLPALSIPEDDWFHSQTNCATVAGITRFGQLTSNQSDRLQKLKVMEHEFYLPPKSTFLLWDCAGPDAFHAGIRLQAQDAGKSHLFDLIVLDPPWSNASVDRHYHTSHSTYATQASPYDMRQLLTGMQLDKLMSQECLVGMWITNKPALLDFVLGPRGIFKLWGLELVEEWVLLKTTQHGEPVLPLDALWRKPYEVFLLARKVADGEPSNHLVTRRALIGVPDVHSRKPCLKRLLETRLANAGDYRALEVFARHLVAGWWSWGNECIKFNWTQSWTP